MPPNCKFLHPGSKMSKQNCAVPAPSKHCDRPPLKNEILDDKLSEEKELTSCQKNSVEKNEHLEGSPSSSVENPLFESNCSGIVMVHSYVPKRAQVH